MIKNLGIGILCSLLLAACNTSSDRFAVSNGQIGNVTAQTLVKQLDSIFANDSIVPLSPVKDALGTQGEVDVYEKGGAKLLRLSPDIDNDPEAVITNIRIYDERYKTSKVLSIKSTFKDLKDNYEMEGMQTSFDAVVIFLKDSDVFVTIDKKQLPENLRYDPSITIDATQIPDNATFKYFMASWEDE